MWESERRGEAGFGLDPTGERLMPDAQHGELVHAEHLARYLLAAQLASGRRVLDAACGEGYGTALLAAAGTSSAVGVDVDGATVAHARRRYGLEFVQADIAALPFEDDGFDLVVSFETIEHVQDPEAVLAELRRVLAPDGLLVISTPNKLEYLVQNEFHVREFTHEEFAALLGRLFPSVHLLYQQNWLTSTILRQDGLREGSGERALAADLRKVASVEPGRELYTVALCGTCADAAVEQVVVAAGIYEAHELAHRLTDAIETQARWRGEADYWHDRWEQATTRLNAMALSRSWRLTRPLRAPAKLGRWWRER